jgi:hypothetical protein
MSYQFSPTATEEIEELLRYLTRTNPHFALWALYKRGVSVDSVASEWHQFLLEQLGPDCEDEIEFASAMVELDKLLAAYLNQKRPLPMLSFERICLLHHLRGPERLAQTRAILGTLTAELAPCMSA